MFNFILIPEVILFSGLGYIFILTIYILYFRMPGFFKYMPKNDDKQYLACVISTHLFKEDEEVYYSKSIKGLRNAYIKARLAALYYDNFVIPKYYWRGVNYGVREVK